MEFTKQELARLMLDNAKGKVVMPANFSEGEHGTVDEVISDAFLQVMNLTKDATEDDIQMAFRKEEVRNGIFAIVEEVIREGIITEEFRRPFFDRFVETKSTKRGDRNAFYVEARNEVVVSRISKDGVVALDRQRFDDGDEISVKVATYGIKVYESLARIVLGRTDWGKFVMSLQEAIEKDVAERCYLRFMEVLSKLPKEFAVRGTTGANTEVTKAAILKVIRNVKMAAGVTSVTLVGTDLALANLQGAVFTDLTEDIKNEIHNTGRIGKWQGHALMELPNAFKQGTGMKEVLLNDNQILVVPNNVEKPVKHIIEPELMDINGSGVRVDDTIEFAVRYSMGVEVITGTVIGLVEFHA